ncbi:MAG: glycosyl transferase family 2 [Desulfovibrionaceae bacterium]|nr:glycosyl transferase family 2 [Desulfovibrionaceae bacterium]
MKTDNIQYSLITPSRGDRPCALAQAVDAVKLAAEQAGLSVDGLSGVEMLVGFDGVKGERVRDYPFIRYFDFPKDNDFGNAIRHGLLKASRGRRIIFHDDDNVLTPQAFCIYEAYPEADMLIGRIDVSRAFAKPWLPEIVEGRELVRQCNIDPLCLCLARSLVVDICGGWQGQRYEADFLNIVRYYRRARKVIVVEDLLGIYDAGRGLDAGGLNFRQERLENSD